MSAVTTSIRPDVGLQPALPVGDAALEAELDRRESVYLAAKPKPAPRPRRPSQSKAEAALERAASESSQYFASVAIAKALEDDDLDLIDIAIEDELDDREDELLNSQVDLSDLEPEIQERVRHIADAVRRNVAKSTAIIVEIGRLLEIAKQDLPHGMFRDWCQVELGIDRSRVARLLNIARLFAKVTICDFSRITAAEHWLGLIAGPKAPEEAQGAFVDLLDDGQTITSETIRDLLAQHQAPPAAPPAEALIAVEPDLHAAASAWADAADRATGRVVLDPPTPAPAAAVVEPDSPFARTLGDADAGRAMLELFDLARYSGSSSALLAAAGTDAVRRKRLIDAAKKVRGLADDLIQEAAR